MSEKLCLQWNDFKENVNAAFGSLRDDKEFSDVTLACEDGYQMEAHKVILAASSPVLMDLLRKMKHPHPMIYLKGFQSQDLEAILDFLYLGEAKVSQENLDPFLAAAEQLKLKGLSAQNSEDWVKSHPPLKPEPNPAEISKDSVKEIKSVHIGVPYQEVSLAGDLEDLEQRVLSMMEKSENLCPKGKQKVYTCKVCGKEAKGRDIKDHIEARHLDGIAIPCNLF